MSEELLNEDLYERTRVEQWEREAVRAHGLSRRQVLKLAAAGAPLLAGLGRLSTAPAARAQSVPASPIVKPLPPEWFVNYGTNAEMRWDAAGDQGYTIANERFFVRDHTSTPTIDAKAWRLRVFGSGLRRHTDADHALELRYDDLARLPRRSVTSFIECAGNGRSFFGLQQGTPAAGTQWGLGAVGVARWTGVPLAAVLERAGIRRDAVDVMPAGLDPTYVSGGVDYGHVRRPLPVAKAWRDGLLAFEMNGRTLPSDHGFPVRLVVPGWVGVANIKWVGDLEVSAQPLLSPFNSTFYRLTGPTYPPDQPGLTTQDVKSAFELARGAQLPAGERLVLRGRSWSGHAPIRRVEVSTDGGTHWRQARLRAPNLPGAWVRWELPWHSPPAGDYELLARATDVTGNTQPDTVPFNTGGYAFWAVVRHPVTVVSAA
jgi:DMSO/TMAO reductase YedYZ molybdopterin-dependent catalytic subunit